MSKSKYTQLNNEVRIQIRDRNGALSLDDVQIVRNTIMPQIPELLPHLVKLEAESLREGHPVWQAKFFIRRFETGSAENNSRRQLTERDIAPIHIDGRTFRPIFWGSAVKSGSVIYYDQDIAVDLGFLVFSEDSTRVSRAWLPRGDNGGIHGGFKVLMLEPGTEFNGWTIGDGFGYMNKDIYHNNVSYGRPSLLGHSSNMTASFFLDMVWDNLVRVPYITNRTRRDIINHIEHICGDTPTECRYDPETCEPILAESPSESALLWYTHALTEYAEAISSYVINYHYEVDVNSPLFKEMKEDIEASINFVNEPKWNDLVAAGGSRAAHDALVAADPIMSFHPWISETTSDHATNLRARVGMAPQLRSIVYVAVPCPKDVNAVWPSSYQVSDESVASQTAIIYGQPVTNSSAVSVVDDVVTTGELADRMAALEVVQYTFTTDDLGASFKGQLGLISPEDMIVDGVQYDVIFSSEDSKIGRTYKQYKRVCSAELTGSFVFVRLWGAGSAFGIVERIWHNMGKDYDGDSIYVLSGNRYPLVTGQVREWMKREIPKLKIAKTKTKIDSTTDMRPYQAAASMANVVGSITNARQVFYSLPVDERAALAELTGHKTPEQFYAHIALIHQLGEDIFKTSWKNTDKNVRPTVDMLLGQMSWVASAIADARSHFGAAANHTTWKSDQYAFKTRIPVVGYLTDLASQYPDDVDMRKWILSTGVDVSVRGFVAPYQRWVLPQIKLDVMVEVRPLSHYESFGYPAPTPEAADEIRYFNTAYKSSISRANQMSPDDWNTFTGHWTSKLDELVKRMAAYRPGTTKYEVCCWLWYASHHDQKTGGNVVMALALPEAIRIVKEKPGRKILSNARKIDQPVAEINVINPAYQFDLLVDNLDFMGEVVEFAAPAKDGKVATRRAIVNTGNLLPGQKQPGAGYPANMVALIDKNSEGQVPTGSYRCAITRSGKVWRAKLFAVAS